MNKWVKIGLGVIFILSITGNVVFFTQSANLRKANKAFKEAEKLLQEEKDHLLSELDVAEKARESIQETLDRLDDKNKELRWLSNKKSLDNRKLEAMLDSMLVKRKVLAIQQQDYTDAELLERLINDYYRYSDPNRD